MASARRQALNDGYVRTHLHEEEEDEDDRPRRDHRGGTAKTILTTIMVVLLIAAMLFGILYVTVLKDHFTVDPGETTTVTLSADVKVVEVPDLVGKYYAAIEHSPRYASFTFTEVEAYSDEASGKIIAQNIDAGTRVSEGTNIELTVSKGPEQITMPEVTGSTYDDASARLTALGFKVSRADIANDGTEISGTVKSASVQAGTQHRKGTLVVLQVWDEPATMTTESTTEADITEPSSEDPNFFGNLTGGTN